MYRRASVKQAEVAIKQLIRSGDTLAQAVSKLHGQEGMSFDDLWMAVMHIQQTSEKEAMQLTKQWCR